MSETVRVAAIQAKRRLIPYRWGFDEALEGVRANLNELVALAERAAESGCRVVAFPEDTLGTLEWEAGHWEETAAFLRLAETAMLERFTDVAARRGVVILCCNDCADGGHVYNTAILIGSDGREIGRYRKVQLPLQEQ